MQEKKYFFHYFSTKDLKRPLLKNSEKKYCFSFVKEIVSVIGGFCR